VTDSGRGPSEEGGETRNARGEVCGGKHDRHFPPPPPPPRGAFWVQQQRAVASPNTYPSVKFQGLSSTPEEIPTEYVAPHQMSGTDPTVVSSRSVVASSSDSVVAMGYHISPGQNSSPLAIVVDGSNCVQTEHLGSSLYRRLPAQEALLSIPNRNDVKASLDPRNSRLAPSPWRRGEDGVPASWQRDVSDRVSVEQSGRAVAPLVQQTECTTSSTLSSSQLRQELASGCAMTSNITLTSKEVVV